MSVDYDLLIIGSTPASVWAATTAANLQARVAWVTQPMEEGQVDPWMIPLWVEMGNRLEQTSRSPTDLFGSLPIAVAQQGSAAETIGQQEAVPWNQVEQWMGAIAANLEALRSPIALASLGIDVIDARGEFCRKPVPGFTVAGRFLQARRYLIATDCSPSIPAIAALPHLNYASPGTLLHHLPTWNPGQRVIVLGGDPNVLPLVQVLARLGYHLTVILPEANWIFGADPEVLALVRAQFEIDGIQLLTQAEVIQVKTATGQVWVQVGNHVLEADHLILASKQRPQIESLNLAAVGVQWNEQGILCNLKRQTTNPRVYCCAGQVGGGYFPQVALAEARVAVQNALFWANRRISDRQSAIALKTQPEIAWVGLTESAALHRYGKKVAVLQRSLNTVPNAQICSNLTGLCKLIVHQNGTLLGAHWAGTGASEGIGILTLAIQQNLKIDAIAQLNLPSPTLAEILTQTAADWRSHPINRDRRLSPLLESFFTWRRVWER